MPNQAKTYPVFNPATEAEIAQVPLGGKADVDQAVDAARKAFPLWSEKPAGRTFSDSDENCDIAKGKRQRIRPD